MYNSRLPDRDESGCKGEALPGNRGVPGKLSRAGGIEQFRHKPTQMSDHSPVAGVSERTCSPRERCLIHDSALRESQVCVPSIRSARRGFRRLEKSTGAHVNLYPTYFGNGGGRWRFEMQRQRLRQIREGFVFRRPLVRDVNFKALGDMPFAFVRHGCRETALHLSYLPSRIDLEPSY